MVQTRLQGCIQLSCQAGYLSTMFLARRPFSFFT